MKKSLFLKIFFLLASFLLFTGIFAGCSSDSGSDNEESGSNCFAGKTFYGSQVDDSIGSFDVVSLAFAKSGNYVAITYFDDEYDQKTGKSSDKIQNGTYSLSGMKAVISISGEKEKLVTSEYNSKDDTFTFEDRDEKGNTHIIYFSLTKGKKLSELLSGEHDKPNPSEPDYVTITFNADFVEQGALAPKTLEKRLELKSNGITLPLNTFTREGYVFKGWGLSSNSSYVSYADGATITSITGDKTLYAVWAPVKFTITYNANFLAEGKSEAETVTQTVDTRTDLDSSGKITLRANTFSRDDYIFMGWGTYSTSTYVWYKDGDTTSSITGNETLYAVWKAKSELKKITFNANFIKDGESEAESKIQYVEAGAYVNLEANTFSREGYSFVGWAKSADAESKDYSDKYSYFKTDSDITLYAVWKDELHYFITYDANGGEGTMAKQSVAKDSVDSTIATATLNANTFTKSGYVFYGWNTYASSIYSISYIDEEEISLTGDEKLYAIWLPASSAVKITYNSNFIKEGASEAETKIQYLYTSSYSSKLQKNTFERSGFTFKGWSTSSAATSGTYSDGEKYVKFSSDTTLYAVWEYSGNCTITFNANDGSENPATSTQEAAGGLTAYLNENTFTRKDYTFIGWSERADDTYYTYRDGASYKPTSEKITLYAIWQKNPVITFIGNGGTDSKGNTSVTQVVEYGKRTALSANTFTKSDSTFAGWSTSSIGTRSIYDDKESVSLTSDLTLYAIWKDPVDVTLNMNGGSGANIISSAKYSNGNFYFTFPEVESTKEGYVLAGWATSETAVSPSYKTGSIVSVTKSTTYYAVWIQPTGVTVTVSVKEVTSPDDVSLTYDENSHSLKADLLGSETFIWMVDGKEFECSRPSFNIYQLTEGLHTVFVMASTSNGIESATAVVTVKKNK